MNTIEKLASEVFKSVQEYVERTFTPLAGQLSDVKSMVEVMKFAPPSVGAAGVRGEQGSPGKDGAVGQRGPQGQGQGVDGGEKADVRGAPALAL